MEANQTSADGIFRCNEHIKITLSCSAVAVETMCGHVLTIFSITTILTCRWKIFIFSLFVMACVKLPIRQTISLSIGLNYCCNNQFYCPDSQTSSCATIEVQPSIHFSLCFLCRSRIENKSASSNIYNRFVFIPLFL